MLAVHVIVSLDAGRALVKKDIAQDYVAGIIINSESAANDLAVPCAVEVWVLYSGPCI